MENITIRIEHDDGKYTEYEMCNRYPTAPGAYLYSDGAEDGWYFSICVLEQAVIDEAAGEPLGEFVLMSKQPLIGGMYQNGKLLAEFSQSM